MIRVRESGCSAYTSFVNLDTSLGVDRWGQPGLEIQWVSPREPVCGSQVDCDDGGNSTCGLDPAESGIRRCFCNSPLVWDPIQGVCVKCELSTCLLFYFIFISGVLRLANMLAIFLCVFV